MKNFVDVTDLPANLDTLPSEARPLAWENARLKMSLRSAHRELFELKAMIDRAISRGPLAYTWQLR